MSRSQREALPDEVRDFWKRERTMNAAAFKLPHYCKIRIEGRTGNGPWGVRNALADENALVKTGQMKAEELLAKANKMADQWRNGHMDDAQIRVVNEW